MLLDAIRPANAYGWIFPNRVGGALDLANIAERVIKPVFKANGLDWKGWHAYRRGLATNLKKLGVPDTTIQAVIRHESVSTTQRPVFNFPDWTDSTDRTEHGGVPHR